MARQFSRAGAATRTPRRAVACLLCICWCGPAGRFGHCSVGTSAPKVYGASDLHRALDSHSSLSCPFLITHPLSFRFTTTYATTTWIQHNRCRVGSCTSGRIFEEQERPECKSYYTCKPECRSFAFLRTKEGSCAQPAHAPVRMHAERRLRRPHPLSPVVNRSVNTRAIIS